MFNIFMNEFKKLDFFNMKMALLEDEFFVYGCFVLTNVNKPDLLDKPGTCSGEGVLLVQLVLGAHSIF